LAVASATVADGVVVAAGAALIAGPAGELAMAFAATPFVVNPCAAAGAPL
jgi:hypothetical protein